MFSSSMRPLRSLCFAILWCVGCGTAAPENAVVAAATPTPRGTTTTNPAKTGTGKSANGTATLPTGTSAVDSFSQLTLDFTSATAGTISSCGTLGSAATLKALGTFFRGKVSSTAEQDQAILCVGGYSNASSAVFDYLGFAEGKLTAAETKAYAGFFKFSGHGTEISKSQTYAYGFVRISVQGSAYLSRCTSGEQGLAGVFKGSSGGQLSTSSKVCFNGDIKFENAGEPSKINIRFPDSFSTTATLQEIPSP